MPAGWVNQLGKAVFVILVFAGFGVAGGQEKIFQNDFEEPIKLKVATFNTRTAFHGSNIDNQYVANPANVTTTINTFNTLELDIVGLQEVHDYAALEILADGTGLNLGAAKTVVSHIFPTALLSRLEVVSMASYNTDGVVRLINEMGIRMPDGTIAYLFSIHVSWEHWGRVHAQVCADIILRRAGSHPVLVFGDMNGHTNRMLDLTRGALSLLYDQGIDAILGSQHFNASSAGTNHGNLGFSDHPLLTVEVAYQPGSEPQADVPSLYHAMPKDTTWAVGADIAPDTSALQGIVIKSLPASGQLKLDGVVVAEDDLVPASDLHDLVFHPDPGRVGKDWWKFRIAELGQPRVEAPRFVDVFVQDQISDIRFARHTLPSPDTTSGEGFTDLAYANVGEFIYPLDDGSAVNDDTFNENLPEELQGLLFIRNGGRNESQWGGEYMRFNLQEASQVYVALGYRGDGTDRDLPGWTEQWSNVPFNTGSVRPYDIFSRCIGPGEVAIIGNGTAYHLRSLEENLVVFIGASCADPVPGCDNIQGNWASEARDCAREDCSDGRWHSWDGKHWCRALIVNEFENWTIARDPSKANFRFWADWGAWDLNDCGDGETTISIPECGLSEVVVRGGVEQELHCDVGSLETITIVKEQGECDYVIIGDPHFD